jgi:uncharacterized protein (TIGR03086 family)
MSPTDSSAADGAQSSQLPYFTVTVPPGLAAAPDVLIAHLRAALYPLAGVLAGSAGADPTSPTPCADYDLSALRDHVLGWLEFFAAALADPDRRAPRPDPMTPPATVDADELRRLVLSAATTIEQAVRDGVQGRDVALSASRMSGPAALGMLLGEYLVHGWDLAVATGVSWAPPDAACDLARELLAGMVTDEYRGAEHGAFAAEIAVAEDAPALDRLLGFAGRDPRWTPPAAG